MLYEVITVPNALDRQLKPEKLPVYCAILARPQLGAMSGGTWAAPCLRRPLGQPTEDRSGARASYQQSACEPEN